METFPTASDGFQAILLKPFSALDIMPLYYEGNKRKAV